MHAQPHCVLCGYQDAPVHLPRPRFAVRHCPHCRVLWCDPTRFDTAFRPEDEAAYLQVEASVHTENATRLHHLMHYAGPDTHPRLLEIGCMHGDFVGQAHGAGYQARGLDLSVTAIAEGRSRLLDDSIAVGTLDERQPDASLDVVAAFNVIEHMDRPDRFLDHVTRVLRPGGVLIIETPAQESVYHHALFMRARVQSQGDFEVGVHPGTHIFKFGRRAWRIILADRKFELLELSPRSTPLRELLAKNKRGSILQAGIIAFGVLGRVTGWENRVLILARRP